MRHAESLSKLLNFVLTISTLLGKTVLAKLVCRSCAFSIGDRELFTDFIMLDIEDFNVILGMTWLVAHYATIHCYLKEVVFHMSGQLKFSLQGLKHNSFSSVFFAIQADKLLQRGFQGYLTYVVDSQTKKMKIDDIPIVRDFVDISQKISPVCLQIERLSLSLI